MKKDYISILIVISLICVFGGYIYHNRNNFERSNLSGVFEITNPAKIITDNNRNKYIIDDSKKRIVKLNNINKVDFIISGGKRNEYSFFNAEDMALDGEGNFYVLESVFYKGTAYIEKQRIFKYDSSGNFIKVLYNKDFPITEQLGEGRLVNLKYIKDKLYCVFRGDLSYTLIEINKESGESGEVQSFPYDNPQINIIDFDFTEDLKSIAFITQKGEVWLQNEKSQLVTSDYARDNLFVPWDIRIDDKSNIYLMNIDNGKIEKINLISKSTDEIVIGDNQIFSSFDLKNEIITAIGEDYIIISDHGNKTIIENNFLELETDILIARTFFWMSLFMILFLTIFLISIVCRKFLKGNMSPAFLQSSVSLIFILITAIIVANVMYNSFTSKYKQDLSDQLKMIAYLSKDKVDIEAIQRISKRSHYMNDDYKKIYKELHELFNQSKDDWNNKFYGDIYKVEDNKVYAIAFFNGSGGTYLPYMNNFEESYFYDAVTDKKIVSGIVKDVYGEWIYVDVPLQNEDGDVIAVLEVGTDLYTFTEYNKQLLKNIALDVATLLVIVALILVELTIYNSLRDKKLSEEEKKDSQILIIRPLAFLLTTGYCMSLSFIPLLTEKLYVTSIMSIPKSVVLGIPISVEMLCIAFASVVGGYIGDKKGGQFTFILGSFIIAISAILSAVAWEPISLILSRGISGLGYGLALTSAHLFAMSDKDETKQNKALAYLSSGGYAGMSCGVAIGGMLAQRIGFSNVFYFIAVIAIAAVFFAYKMMKNPKIENTIEYESYSNKIINFFKNLNVVAFLLFVCIPVSICGMFLDYFFPIFADAMGYSSADSSRVFMAYGICIIYLGPVLTKFVSKYFGAKTSIIFYILMVVGGLAYYAAAGTISSAIVAVILLGLAESFGVVVGINYLMGLRASKELGEGMSLGFYELVENIGQMLGPIVFGILILFGYSKGVGILAISTALLLLIFIILSRKEHVKTLAKNEIEDAIIDVKNQKI